MSLIGKITIINSLMSTLFVYRMQVLPMLTEKYITMYNDMVREFIWKGKKEKIPLSHLQANKECGGLGLVNIVSKHTSLLLNWIIECREHREIANLAITALGVKNIDDLERIWASNLTKTDSKTTFPGGSFWHGIVHDWHEYNHHDPQSQEHVLNQWLAMNSAIKVNKKVLGDTFFVKDDSNIAWKIRDIYDVVKGEFRPISEIETRFALRIKWLEYKATINAIPNHWKFFLKSENCIDNTVSKYEMIANQKKVSRMIYRDLQESLDIARHCCQVWGKKTNIIVTTPEFIVHFKNIYQVTDIVKFREFQYRLLHNKIFCNDVLVHWGKVSSNVCNLCNLKKQNIQHLMYECDVVKGIWEKVQTFLSNNSINFQLSFENILFNNVVVGRPAHIASFLVLVTKQYIFRCKCMDQKPSYTELKCEWKKYQQIDSYNSKKCGRERKNACKWRPVKLH